MPKVAMDYSKTVMYKIVCNDLTITDCYVGHTTNFTKRKACHKCICHNENDKNHNLKIYHIIRDNGGFENWNMVKVEDFKCDSLLEARKRERELYEEFNANMNSVTPYRSKEENQEQKKICYQKNKDSIIKHRKDYLIKNKDSITQRTKEYRERNKYFIADQHKQYRENNKDKIKEYYEKNKDLISEKMKVKLHCEFCNKEMRKDSMWRHLKTCKMNL